MTNRPLTRVLKVLTSPTRLKQAIAARLVPRLNRLLEKLLPPAFHARVIQLETEMAEARLRLMQLEARSHLARVGAMASTSVPTGAPTSVPSVTPAPPSLLIDLRITQIEQRERGIPRYATALALALPEALPGAAIAYLIDPKLPAPDALDSLAERGRIVQGAQAIAELPRLTHYLQSCLFELHKSAEELFPEPLARFKPRLCTIVYDLIPWLYPEHYLTTPYLTQRYRYQLGLLDAMDQLFAISECARQDAIRLAHLQPERVHTIYGGIDPERWPPPNPAATAWPLRIRADQPRSIQLTGPYWLYVGGADFRKNAAGLVQAFAQLMGAARQPGAAPAAMPAPRLVIACNLSRSQQEELYRQGRALGLMPGQDLIITGYVSDSDLGLLYQHAYATVFPSHYEGLGLPVLESYHFGKPALAGDNSALREVTHPKCLFDASDAASIAAAMQRLQQDPALAAQSIAFGRAILARCNWQAAARAVAVAIQVTKSPA